MQAEDVILAFISSRMASAVSPAAHLLDTSDSEFASTGLKLPSVIRLDKLATLHRNMLRRRLGCIGPSTDESVARCLRYVFDL
jgi:mRNA interferase MazF